MRKLLMSPRKFLLGCSFMVLCLVVMPSRAGFIHLDPWNLAQNTLTAAQTLSTLEQQIQQVKDEATNLQNYSNDPNWTNSVAGELSDLGSITQQGMNLSSTMSASATNFNQQYPGYKPAQDYPTQYQSWSQNTMSSLQSVLSGVGLQLSNLQNEQATLAALHGLNNAPNGRLQAMQIATNMAATTANQLMQLRQLVGSQTNAQSAYMAYQVQKDQSEEASTAGFIANSDTSWPGYHDNGFGPNNLPGG
jgi:P-type conjugative transfer protein TrbJ